MPRKSKGKGKGKETASLEPKDKDKDKDMRKETASLEPNGNEADCVRGVILNYLNLCCIMGLLSLEANQTWKHFANNKAYRIPNGIQLRHIKEVFSMNGTTHEENVLIRQVKDFIPIWQQHSGIWHIGCGESYKLLELLLDNNQTFRRTGGTSVKSVLELGGGVNGLHGLRNLCDNLHIKYMLTDEKTGWTIKDQKNWILENGWTHNLVICAFPYGSMVYDFAEMLGAKPLPIETTILMFLSFPLGRQLTIETNDHQNFGKAGQSLTGPILAWSDVFSKFPDTHHTLIYPGLLWIADIHPATPEHCGRAGALVATPYEEEAELIHEQVIDYLYKFEPRSFALFVCDYGRILGIYKWEELVEKASAIIGRQSPEVEIHSVPRHLAHIEMTRYLQEYEDIKKKKGTRPQHSQCSECIEHRQRGQRGQRRQRRQRRQSGQRRERRKSTDS